MGLNVCIWVYLFNPNTWPVTSPKFKLRNYRFFREFLLSWGITALKNLYLHKYLVRKGSSFSFYDRRRLNFRAFTSRGISWLLCGLKLCPSKRHQHGVSIQSLINLDKTFFRIYRIYEISHRPDSWRGFLYICLLSFPRFWTFFIEWFAFLFLRAWQWK